MQDEIVLVKECQNGNAQAFGQLYDKYIEKIYKFIYFKTHHKETAEDITSQVFTKALEKIKSYRPDKATFSGWLYAIARNAVIDHYRTQKTESNVEDAWDLSDGKNLAYDTDARLQIEQISKYMKELNSVQRDIVIMRVWQGLDYREIAGALGKSEANCRMSYMRGISILKDKVPFAVYLVLLLNI